METGLTLLHQALLPSELWTYSFAAAVYLINRLPSPVIHNNSPFQKLFSKQPNYLKLQVFGCLCFPWLRPYRQHKLDSRSLPCVFLGYSISQSAYLCLHVSTGRIYTSRHVQFVETIFPYDANKTTTPSSSEPVQPVFAPPTIIPAPHSPLVPAQVQVSSPPDQDPHTTPSAMPSPSNSVIQEQSNANGTEINSTEMLTSSAQVHTKTPNTFPTQTSPAPLPTQTSPAPSPTQNIPTPSPTQTTNSSQSHSSSSSSIIPTQQSSSPPPVANNHPMQTHAKNKITKPTKKLTFIATSPDPKPEIPTSVAQALRDQRWRESMGDEYKAQIRNGTFELVHPDPAQNVIPTKWVHTIKYLPNGVLDRYKSRWVARGDNQEYGLDYAETFSPVVKSITIRLVLQLTVTRYWKIKQFDINNAFLQGTLTDEVYVTQPPGFVDADHPHHVCKLKKALYGLKQAPRAWNQELKTYLTQMGCQNSVADTSVFIYLHGTHIVYILVYVDDIIVTGSSHSLLDAVIRALAARFSLKEPTDLRYFLGVEATRTSHGLHLMQRKYVQDLLDKTNMLDSKPVATPMPTSPKLTLSSGYVLDDPREYSQVVGSLQYLALTQPDIAYCVNRLAQFMHRPTDLHWHAVNRVLRYLAGTTSHGIFLSTRPTGQATSTTSSLQTPTYCTLARLP